MATLSEVPLLSRYVYIHSFITHHSYISHKCNLFAQTNGTAQTNGIVGDVQIANIDLNHFLNTHLTKWLKRKNFSPFFFYRALLIRIAL